MNMKKLVLIGGLALAIIGCVLVAGCTSNTSTEEFVVGTWTTDDGKKTFVLTNDLKGVYIDGDNLTDIIWEKTADGKYKIRGAEIQETVTLEKAQGILTNATGTVFTNVGTVLTNVLSGTSAALTDEKDEKLEKIVDKLEGIEEKLDDKKDELKGKLEDKINELESLKEEIEYEQEVIQKVREAVQKQREQVEEKIR